MKDLIKKYAFIVVIAILLLGSVLYFAYEDNASKLPGKVVDGNNIIFSIGDDDVTADEFYDILYNEVTNNNKLGDTVIANHLQQDLTDLAIETTDEMSTEASEYSKNQITQLKQSLGANYDEEMKKLLAQVGLKDSNELDAFFLVQLKALELQNSSLEELYPEYKETNKPRILSHILVKAEQTPEQKEANEPATITDEIQAKMDSIKTELANGVSFSEVATLYSEDTGSGANGGLLGLYDTSNISQLVKPFADAAMALNSGETSEWITSEFGQHLILFETDDFDTIMEKHPEELTNLIFSAKPNYIGDKLIKVGEENSLEFTNAELKDVIYNIISPKENEKEDEKEDEVEDTTNEETEGEQE